MNEFLVPEIVFRVPKQFDEGDHSSPRVWPMDNESLQQDFGHDFSEAIILHL